MDKVREEAWEDFLDMTIAQALTWAAQNINPETTPSELVHPTWTGEAHLRHLLYRQETRWPGYYYRADYPNLDDAN